MEYGVCIHLTFGKCYTGSSVETVDLPKSENKSELRDYTKSIYELNLRSLEIRDFMRAQGKGIRNGIPSIGQLVNT